MDTGPSMRSRSLGRRPPVPPRRWEAPATVPKPPAVASHYLCRPMMSSRTPSGVAAASGGPLKWWQTTVHGSRGRHSGDPYCTPSPTRRTCRCSISASEEAVDVDSSRTAPTTSWVIVHLISAWYRRRSWSLGSGGPSSVSESNCFDIRCRLPSSGSISPLVADV